jgi:L-amino acid N-acyltransferase YncA
LESKITLREMSPADWESVGVIYAAGINTETATFETQLPKYKDWDAAHLTFCRVIAMLDRTIVGWAALSPISKRHAYQGVTEVSVYIHPNFFGMKIGQKLLTELITQSELHNIWMLQATIFQENTLSINLHQKMGFRMVGYRERIGIKNGTWRNTVLMERRSSQLGNDQQ